MANSTLGGFHEEGEPETVCDPHEPLSDETVEKLREQGMDLPAWQPTMPSTLDCCRCAEHKL